MSVRVRLPPGKQGKEVSRDVLDATGDEDGGDMRIRR